MNQFPAWQAGSTRSRYPSELLCILQITQPSLSIYTAEHLKAQSTCSMCVCVSQCRATFPYNTHSKDTGQTCSNLSVRHWLSSIWSFEYCTIRVKCTLGLSSCQCSSAISLADVRSLRLALPATAQLCTRQRGCWI